MTAKFLSKGIQRDGVSAFWYFRGYSLLGPESRLSVCPSSWSLKIGDRRHFLWKDMLTPDTSFGVMTALTHPVIVSKLILSLRGDEISPVTPNKGVIAGFISLKGLNFSSSVSNTSKEN